MKEEASVVIGGEAGDGVRAAGNVMGTIFNRHGLDTFVRDDYMSLIRGGHNFSQIRASPEEVRSQLEEADVVVALDERSIENHEDRLNENGILIYDSDSVDYDSDKAGPMPMESMVEDVGGIEIMRNSAAIGAIAFLFGLDLEIVKGVLKKAYGEKAEENLVLAEKGYEFAGENLETVKEMETSDRDDLPLFTGNQTIPLGAAKAGLDVYIAYPMTPSTSILHFAANYEDELGLAVVQPENEIGVINMALGSAYAGARSMIATSGGGFSLMQEAMSLAGMSETPLLVVNCQRPGPSTGVPTYTAQADLNFVLDSGQGEYPLVVVAPGDTEEAFKLAGDGLNLAWNYQTPVILLSDKHLSESWKTTRLDPEDVKPEEGKLAEDPGEEYKRYEITEDGVSPLAFPGTKDTVVKTTSYEHLEFGWTTEEPEEIEKMQDKRLDKWETIRGDILGGDREVVKVYGDPDADNVILAWGSTKGAILDAMDIVDLPVKMVQPLYLKPFPAEEVLEYTEGAGKVVAVENNATGQLARLMRQETLTAVDEKILKYDSRPFDPVDLAERIEEVF